ncbi:aminodeoxychorismate lyase [Antrihabitans cavernicola]|uniref:Aminodeoxychorismate lyase n=1 Tax=Antrihabitans cavernicola TaxID=2495913 RepID=A0A5A7SBB0_9NOCA|nr:aminodeoxychorismate lyase [Spelaeibacter cavernicola]KAA0021863.1 aminodeoxychorismate lyase [Spelaeibacter cavernicola]
MAARVLVTLDGTSHDADTPLLCADDMAAVRGDGVFETVLVRSGRACVLEYHLERLATSAGALELPKPDLDEWRSAVEVAVAEWGSDAEGMLRIVLSRGRESGGEPTAFITVGPVADRVQHARTEGVSAMTLARGHSIELSQTAPWQLLGAKTLSYATNMAALRFAARYDTDDVIFVSSEGRVLEGPRSTVVIMRDKTLITPPAKHGILSGTTQRALYEVAEDKGYTCEYEPMFPADLITADGVWLVSGVTLAARVHTLDGLPLDKPAAAAEFAEMVDLAVETIGT